jgi:hypothetical protein
MEQQAVENRLTADNMARQQVSTDGKDRQREYIDGIEKTTGNI